VNFPFICSNIPAAPAYGISLSQMIRYSRACGSYQDFLDRGLLLTRKLLNHFENFTVASMTWLTVMEYLCHKWPRIFFTCLKHFPVLSPFTTYYRVCNLINTTDASSGGGNAYSSRAPEFTPGFLWGSCYSIFSFIYVFYWSLFVLFYFFFWPLCCLFFFDIQILVANLVSSNSSFISSSHLQFLNRGIWLCVNTTFAIFDKLKQ
jgi:hypothetical protein